MEKMIKESREVRRNEFFFVSETTRACNARSKNTQTNKHMMMMVIEKKGVCNNLG